MTVPKCKIHFLKYILTIYDVIVRTSPRRPVPEVPLIYNEIITRLITLMFL